MAQPAFLMEYVSNPGYVGPDSFTYALINAQGVQSNTATVAITVNAPVGESVTGTQVPPSPSITDAAGAVWTLTPSGGAAGNQVTKNNVVDTVTSLVDLLAYVNHVLWQYTKINNSWWSWSGTAWSAPTAVDPRPSPAPVVNPITITVTAGVATTITPILAVGTAATTQVKASPNHGLISISGVNLIYTATPGYSGSDIFTFTVTDSSGHVSPVAAVNITVKVVQESPDNTQVPPAGSITDANGNVWTLVGGKVAQNAVVDTITANVVLLAYENHTVYQEAGGLWWAWTGTAWLPSGGSTVSPIPTSPGAVSATPRVMGLGDSITAGPGVTPNAYYPTLTTSLAAGGITPTYVGSYFNGTANNNGYFGWQSIDIINGHSPVQGSGQNGSPPLDTLLAATPADIVILLIGTNDVQGNATGTTQANISTIIGKVLADFPTARLICSDIPFSTNLSAAAVTTVNNAIKAAVTQANNARCTFAVAGSLVTTFQDGLHPDAAGYVQLGNALGVAVKTLYVAPAVANFALNATTAVAIGAGAAVTSGSATSAQIVTQPAHGTVTVSGVVMTYTSAAGYAGADTFTYTVKNSVGQTSNVATVAVTVSAALPAGGLSYMLGFTLSGSSMQPASVWAGRVGDCFGGSFCWYNSGIGSGDAPVAAGNGHNVLVIATVPPISAGPSPNAIDTNFNTALAGAADYTNQSLGYNAKYYAMANAHKNQGDTFAVRPLHESGGEWYPWNSQITGAQYITLFHLIARIFRAVTPGIIVEYCGTQGRQPNSVKDGAAQFPGAYNAATNPGGCDVVGVDFYTHNDGGSAMSWADVLNGTNGVPAPGIQLFANLAKANGLGLVFSESGIDGTQNAAFTADMIAWFNSQPPNFIRWFTWSKWTGNPTAAIQQQMHMAWSGTKFGGSWYPAGLPKPPSTF